MVNTTMTSNNKQHAATATPAGTSRLSMFFVLLCTIIMTVFVVTIASMESLSASFGSLTTGNGTGPGCRDTDSSTDFKYKGKKGKNCAWISTIKKQSKGKKICQSNTGKSGAKQLISDLCPFTCGRTFNVGKCSPKKDGGVSSIRMRNVTNISKSIVVKKEAMNDKVHDLEINRNEPEGESETIVVKKNNDKVNEASTILNNDLEKTNSIEPALEEEIKEEQKKKKKEEEQELEIEIQKEIEEEEEQHIDKLKDETEKVVMEQEIEKEIEKEIEEEEAQHIEKLKEEAETQKKIKQETIKKLGEEREERKKKKEKKKKEEDEKASPASSVSSTSLLDSILEAQKTMITKLKLDYGKEYYEKIFLMAKHKKDDPNNRDTKDPDRPRSTHMMPYRFIRPIVYTDREGHRSEYAHDGEKDNKTAQHTLSNFQRKLIIKLLRSKKGGSGTNKYVWATGGHSAAAGHGNLYAESYTKVMQRTARDVFSSVGLDFEARNYAMGATASAAEMSMCYQEIFGNDVDIFSWDYGMLEARDYLNRRMFHYTMRGLLSNPEVVPAFVGLQEIEAARKQVLIQLNDAFLTPAAIESTTDKSKGSSDGSGDDGSGDDKKNDDDLIHNNGLALFLGDPDIFKEMKEAIPDTLGMSGEDIQALPTFIRNFKCNGGLEKGDPFCGEEKYNTLDTCPQRMAMVNWHPGWKYMAMVGNSMALFLVDQLVEAIQTITDVEENDDNTDLLLKSLLEEEEHYRQGLLTGPLPELAKTVYWYNNTSDNYRDYPLQEDNDIESDEWSLNTKVITTPLTKFQQDHLYKRLLNVNMFMRGPSVCHTARLPAQTRYYGIVTDTPVDKKVASQMATSQGLADITEVLCTEATYPVGIEDTKIHEQNTVKQSQAQSQSQSGATTTGLAGFLAANHKSYEPLQLSWASHNEREQVMYPDCHELTKIDYRDFFYLEGQPEPPPKEQEEKEEKVEEEQRVLVNQRALVDDDVWEGGKWTVLKFPNESEQKAYNYKQNLDKYQGILLLIFRFCGFDQCEKGFMGYKEYNDKKWIMKVNGQKVSRLTKIGHDAIVLENKDTGVYFKPNKDTGIYDIEMKVLDPTGFVKISAFVLY